MDAAIAKKDLDALFLNFSPGYVSADASGKRINEISAAASCGVSKRAQRQAAAGKWPLRWPLESDKQGYGASSEALTS